MARLTVNGTTIEAPDGKRLVLAIEDEAGVRIGHRCGGQARCTTCRVKFEAGEPERMTKAERAKLAERDLLGQVRLACQLTCQDGMALRVLMTADSEPSWNGDAGARPADQIEPAAEWTHPETS